MKDVSSRSGCSTFQSFALILSVLTCGFLSPSPTLAQTPPPTPPAPIPDSVYTNVFYGAVNPTTANFDTPVLVFVPGLGGVACEWYSTGATGNAPCQPNGVTAPANDMYAYAYQSGYRTAFVSPNADNSPANSSIAADAAVIANVIPRIATYYNTSKLYFVGHSKGGLDLQEAILNANVYPLVKGVFNLSTPNQGTPLANWAFNNQAVTQQIEAYLLANYQIDLNFLSPAVAGLTTNNMATLRAALDPIFEKSLAKPFYTWGGVSFYDSVPTYLTGGLLSSLVPIVDQNSENDGFVTLAGSQLTPEISNDMGLVTVDHFKMNQGHVSFSETFWPDSGHRNHHQRIPAAVCQRLCKIRRQCFQQLDLVGQMV